MDSTQVIPSHLEGSRPSGSPPPPTEISTSRYLEILSRLVFQGYSVDFQKPADNPEVIRPEVEYLSGLSDAELSNLRRIADKHHVLVRALEVVQTAAQKFTQQRIVNWCQASLSRERSRVAQALETLVSVSKALEAAGCPVCVIKSLDHWPDLGSDLDLYTSGDEKTVVGVLADTFNARTEVRSWGDRLANKWNFRVPGLPELIEIHVRYLGQTGEHSILARRVIARSVTAQVNGHSLRIAASEERVLISTLQRMYRHFYFRLCDMADMANLIRRKTIDFDELRRAAESAGIWPGVTTFLLLVSDYATGHGGEAEIPRAIRDAAVFQDIRVEPRGDFLRVPLLPAASLYGCQLLSAGRHQDFRALCRLPLLPPLALTALLAYRLTGSDKGIW
jgi:Uncharacterised nucleotidyltransferase